MAIDLRNNGGSATVLEASDVDATGFDTDGQLLVWNETLGVFEAGTGGGSEYTTAIVNISSAQILTMGTTPIELLPAPGANMHYDIDKIILEYTHVTTGYTFTGNPYLADSGGYWTLNLYDFTNEGANTIVRLNGLKDYWAVGVTVNDFKVGYEITNTSLRLTTDNSADPTLGDGTLRAIIKYKVRTFGA